MQQIPSSTQLPRTFSDLAIAPGLKQVAEEIGYTHLTPIQAMSIPILLAGHDVMGQSQTGSGKTAAFSIPLLDRLALPGRHLQGLIISPTRELCSQIAREIRRLGRRLPGLQVLCLTGGEPLRHQIASMQEGMHIVVGTPGRIHDHLRRGHLNLDSLRTVILDEADRMLDMGFEEDMEAILGACPRNRQTVLFSATFPDHIETLAQKFQNQAQRVTVEKTEVSTPKIQHLLWNAALDQKSEALHQIMAEYEPESAIIFANQRITVQEIVDALQKWGVAAAGIHGDMEQFDRDRVMARLRNRSIRVLVATDVAARGLDVADIELVINFDIPLKSDTFVHRSGRTGRAGKKGIAITLCTPKETRKIERIEQETQVSFERGKAEEQQRQAPNQARAQKAALYQGAAMRTLAIGGGRKDKLRPGDILGALTGEAGGLEASEIGKIEIHDHISYVAIAQSLSKLAAQRLQEGKIKGRKFSITLV